MPSAFLRFRVIVASPSPASVTERIEPRSSALNGVDLLAEVDRNDVRALLRQPHRVRPTLATRRTGNERNLTLQSSHFAFPYV